MKSSLRNHIPLKKSKTFMSYVSYDVTKDSLLDILDSVEEHKENIENNLNKNKNKCKCCDKVILNHKLEQHQLSCFQNKISTMSSEIENLKRQIEYMKENIKENEENLKNKIKHDIHIKGLELLIERNNEKWETVMNK